MVEGNRRYSEQDLLGMVRHAAAGNEVAIAEIESLGINISEYLAEQALNGDKISWRLLNQYISNGENS